MIALALFGCPAPTEVPAPEVPAEIPELDPVGLARRMSLDLRGIPPTLDEYHQVRSDPSSLDALVDTWMADPRFQQRLVELYAEVYLTRTDAFPYTADDLHVPNDGTFAASLGQEAPRIVARIAADDLPYTELVTGDWTMADENLGAAFALDRPDADGWQVSRYTDGRPAAGVLVTNAFAWRYTSTASNLNRKRANQVSRILLCSDYLTKKIDFDRNVNLLDAGAVEDALTQNPACVSCHITLDPIGSYFYGFWWFQEDSAIEASTYHPDRENLWSTLSGVAPGYHGEPGRSLADLGRQIASDDRFVECGVQTAFELLNRRPAELSDFDALTRHREAFLEGGLTLRPLLRSIVSDPAYRADLTDIPGAQSRKLATPDLLASSVEALTGYRWTYLNQDMLGSDVLGVRTLAGGADGTTVTRVSNLTNATAALVQQRLAEGAVAHLFATDPGALLGHLSFTETPDTDLATMQDQLVDLYLAVLGRPVAADGEEVAALLDLWRELYAAEADPRAAWQGVVYAMLRDPDFVLY
ncbi:MAG: DUF1549 domain-containing protein [Myxococcota bacterium]